MSLQRRRLLNRVDSAHVPVVVIDAPAERPPFEDGSFDTGLGTAVA